MAEVAKPPKEAEDQEERRRRITMSWASPPVPEEPEVRIPTPKPTRKAKTTSSKTTKSDPVPRKKKSSSTNPSKSSSKNSPKSKKKAKNEASKSKNDTSSEVRQPNSPQTLSPTFPRDLLSFSDATEVNPQPPPTSSNLPLSQTPFDDPGGMQPSFSDPSLFDPSSLQNVQNVDVMKNQRRELLYLKKRVKELESEVRDLKEEMEEKDEVIRSQKMKLSRLGGDVSVRGEKDVEITVDKVQKSKSLKSPPKSKKQSVPKQKSKSSHKETTAPLHVRSTKKQTPKKKKGEMEEKEKKKDSDEKEDDLSKICYLCGQEVVGQAGKKVGRMVCHIDHYQCKNCKLSFEYEIHYSSTKAKGLFCAECVRTVDPSVALNAGRDSLQYSRTSFDDRDARINAVRRKEKSHKKQHKKKGLRGLF